MSEKDKALLDYMWGQLENIIDYMDRNGYKREDLDYIWVSGSSSEWRKDWLKNVSITFNDGSQIVRREGNEYAIHRESTEIYKG